MLLSKKVAMHFEFEVKNLNYYRITMILSKKVPIHFEFEKKNPNDYLITSKKKVNRKNLTDFQIASEQFSNCNGFLKKSCNAL